MTFFELLLLTVALSIPAFYKSLFCKKTLIVFYLAILAHLLVIVCGLYFIKVPYFYDYDSNGFFNIASFRAERGLVLSYFYSDIYSDFLAVLFRINGKNSWLCACLFSVLMFSLSTLYLLKINLILKTKIKNFIVLSLYAFLPSLIILTSSLLRESILIFSFIFSVWSFLLAFQKNRVRPYILSCFMIILISMIHVAFFIFYILMFSIFFFVFFCKRNLMLCLFSFVTIGVLLVSIDKYNAHGLKYYFKSCYSDQKNHFHLAKKYHHSTPITRATYKNNSTFDVIINYYVRPYLFEVKNTLDLYAFLENLLRLILLIFVIFLPFKKNHTFIFLTILYFSFNILWALATQNYGTGMRHHATTYWLLLILGLTGFRRFLEYYFPNSKIHKLLYTVN
ncbi:MAG: hypothetical protein CMM87_03220 [Rickettsiales bacterium]|mgnify:CR=1 FL=1|nr:hypothetical protein [Rickettsiales bacterium]|tara:strand:- start:12255 stop:13436 length:1182 start_codon:yes stop_codon:yes gene_type:complete